MAGLATFLVVNLVALRCVLRCDPNCFVLSVFVGRAKLRRQTDLSGARLHTISFLKLMK